VESVGNGELLAVEPEALYRIEEGTLLGQPDDAHTLGSDTQRPFEKVRNGISPLALRERGRG